MKTTKKVKDIVKLKKAIKEAIKISTKNIHKAYNIDLEDMSQLLEDYLEQLNDIKDFKTYEECEG